MTIQSGFLPPSLQGGPPVVIGPLGLLLPNEATFVAPGPAITTSPFVVQPNIIALAPGATATVTVSAPGLAPGAIISAVSNLATVTVHGGGRAPGPIAFRIHASRAAMGTALVSFTSPGLVNTPSGAPFPSVPVAIVPMSPNVPQGRSAAQAIATVRRRTNYSFGLPNNEDILAGLNDGLEKVATRIEPVIATASLPIVAPNTNILAWPQDVERVRDVNFSTGNPALGGTVVYEMLQLDFDEFIQETDSTPAGGIGGIPAIFSLIADQAGVMLMQFYPFANEGYVNLHYFKRPILWFIPTNGAPASPSYTDLDSIYQEAAILYGCQIAAESREDDALATKFNKLFEWEFNIENPFNVQYLAKRRVRKRGTNTVRDVSAGESVVPAWMR